MANVLHSTLTGADLHESKGAATATSGQVAIANGTGSAVFATLAYSQVSGTPTLSTVATSGSYNDLSNKPVIPQVYNSTTLSTAPLIKCYSVTSAAGLWSVTLAGFTTVYNVQCTVVSGGTALGTAASACLSAFSTTSVTGSVVVHGAAANTLGTTQVVHVTVVGA